MGLFDWKHWLVILLVALVLFGSKRLKSLGADLGEAISGFRRAVHTEEQAAPAEASARLDSTAEVSGKDSVNR